MSCIPPLESSAYYLEKIQELEAKYAEELDLAGVEQVSEGDSYIEYDDRLKALENAINRYKKLYIEACNYEKYGTTKPNKTARLRTFRNGW